MIHSPSIITAKFTANFDSWRNEARKLLIADVAPQLIRWQSTEEMQTDLFQEENSASALLTAQKKNIRVPPDFLQLSKYVAAHRDASRWALLYRILWRLTHGEHELLKISIDPDIILFQSMYRSVRRDLHKMKAFVRFREVKPENQTVFVAWYEPDHLILRLAVPFFSRRFNGMIWSILTPDESAHWSGELISFSGGARRSDAPGEDASEDLWRTYYTSIFNPARIKIRAMKKELPVRYWKNLPEAKLISGLIHSAPAKLQEFYRKQSKSAHPYLEKARADTLPGEASSLEALKSAALQCQACDLHQNATQTVFGEGPKDAKILLVGEQPGDQEDLQGRAFVGPAGRLLNQALKQAGLIREELYITNAVKHFKWVKRGEVRLHQRPTSSEISVCKSWLMAELKAIKPEVLICLGASAAQSVLGKAVTLKSVRGNFIETTHCKKTLVTTHPSAILRMENEIEKSEEFNRFVSDLVQAKAGLNSENEKIDATAFKGQIL